MSTPATPTQVATRPGGSARSPWAVLAVLCLGLFMLLLDGTIVNIAIPHIQAYYDTTYSNIEWVMNAYILTFAVLLVPLGRFGDLWGRRKLFLAGMVLFTLGSLACGLAPSIYLLIAFRIIQGIGGAAMMPSTLSIIATVFAPERRGAAMGVWGGVSGVASGLGPVLGGIIIQYVTWPDVAASWRWIFLVNIPVGIIGVILTLRLVPESKNPTAVKSLDLPGVGLLTASLFCLTFALIEGQNYGWTSATILALFAGAGVAFLLFYWREHRVSQPLIDFSLFRSLNFAAGNATGLLLSAAMMGAFFTIPIFLQSVLGFSAIKAGLVMAPMSVVIIFAAPVAGMLSDRLGSKWIVATGMFLLAVGLAWMAGLIPGVEGIDPQTTSGSLLVPFLLSRHRHRLRRRPGDLGGHGDRAQGPRRQRLRRALDDAPGRQPDGHRHPRGRAAEPGHGQHHRRASRPSPRSRTPSSRRSSPPPRAVPCRWAPRSAGSGLPATGAGDDRDAVQGLVHGRDRQRLHRGGDPGRDRCCLRAAAEQPREGSAAETGRRARLRRRRPTPGSREPRGRGGGPGLRPPVASSDNTGAAARRLGQGEASPDGE